MYQGCIELWPDYYVLFWICLSDKKWLLTLTRGKTKTCFNFTVKVWITGRSLNYAYVIYRYSESSEGCRLREGIQTAKNTTRTSNWTYPRHVTEHYARLISAFADNTIAVTKLVNNAMFANLEAFKTSVQTARDNVKDFSRIGVNSAKTFEQVARETTANATATVSP